MPFEIPSTTFAHRQDALLKEIPKNSALVISSGNLQYRNQDVAYPFRPDSDFFYLTGLEEPNSVFILGSNESQVYKILLIYNPSAQQKQWCDTWTLSLDHPSLAPYDVFSWQQIDSFKTALKKLNLKYHCLSQSAKELQSIIENLHIQDSFRETLDQQRLLKDDHELALMSEAAKHSSISFVNILEQPFGSFQNESDIASMWYQYALSNQIEQAYNPIIAGSHRACTLHYQNNRQSFDLKNIPAVLMDAGYEYRYYASDITRMILLAKPSQIWLELYEIVLSTQEKIIESVREGVSLIELQEQTCHLFFTELKSGGFLSKTAQMHELKKCYMHSVSHQLGLDVHDCSSINKKSPLKESMVITIEPGLYFNHPDFENEPWYNIGLRIEDDILVTRNGPKVLTTVPKRIDELYANL